MADRAGVLAARPGGADVLARPPLARRLEVRAHPPLHRGQGVGQRRHVRPICGPLAPPQDRLDSCGAGRRDICYGCYYYYGDPGHGPHYDRNDCIFLKGLSEATDLELSADSVVTVLNRDLKWCPTFTKLKTLLLNDWCLAADHNALICFLQHSPILEKLTLQLSEGPSYVTEAEGIYKPLGQSVASNCLKIVEIECANVDKKVSILFALVSAKTRGTNDVIPADGKKLPTFSRRPTPPEERSCSWSFTRPLLLLTIVPKPCPFCTPYHSSAKQFPVARELCGELF
ncbi:uncharacterized protein [Triticum aestivum]|uniref:uncharacterized protein n=1 Tax=Triticum aestivum TaxID=4565 RepID=UPI001D00439B|nr:uncharacterized protein LOC123039391 [Triticum aestivum]